MTYDTGFVNSTTILWTYKVKYIEFGDIRKVTYWQAFYDLGGEDSVTGMVAPSFWIKSLRSQ
jgi:hypothetical protein